MQQKNRHTIVKFCFLAFKKKGYSDIASLFPYGIISNKKLQTDEMKKLTHAVGSLVPPQGPTGGPRPRLDSVAKKHKLDDENDIEEVFEQEREPE